MIIGILYNLLFVAVYTRQIPRYPPRGGYSHTLIIRVCAAVKGMVFKPFCQEHVIDNTHFRSGTGCQIKASLE